MARSLKLVRSKRLPLELRSKERSPGSKTTRQEPQTYRPRSKASASMMSTKTSAFANLTASDHRVELVETSDHIGVLCLACLVFCMVVVLLLMKFRASHPDPLSGPCSHVLYRARRNSGQCSKRLSVCLSDLLVVQKRFSPALARTKKTERFNYL